MNFKKYKSLPAAEKHNEAYYIIGLDIGNDSSAIAFYNLADGAAESIDLSGGYGKPSIPTVMQYVAETKEWVFGEYAVLNRGVGTVFSGLFEKMGRFDHVDVGGRSVSVASVFALFIREILASVKNINPKAEIVGIVASVPAYFSDAAREEFSRVFKLAGFEKELIALVADRECVLARHFSEPPEKTENALVIDLGNRELRGGLYEVSPSGAGISAVSLSSVFDCEISMAALNADVEKLFAELLAGAAGAGTKEFREHLSAFSHQHKDILFQKNIRAKPQKFYFNFVYPPVQHIVEHAAVERLVAPYAERFSRFITDVLEKNLHEKKIAPSSVDAVLCVGGGFEMLWAKDAVTAVFPDERVRFFKNPKAVTAEGAALIAARELGLAGAAFSLEDRHQLTSDIVIANGASFLTLVARNGFWWQKHPSSLILVNSEVSGEIDLEIAALSPAGESAAVAKIKLDDLPPRPKGTTRLEVAVDFKSNTELLINVRDMGFGEIFPQVEYAREFLVRI